MGVLIMMAASDLASADDRPYLGSFVGASLPGYGHIVVSGVVVMQSRGTYLQASDGLTKLCQQHGGIGIVNFRVDMALGQLWQKTGTTVEVLEHGVKYLLYGDCVLSAVPLESPTDKRDHYQGI
jgi:hypothetical protein